MWILKVSTENQWEKLSNRINRTIELGPLNGKSLSDSAPEVIRFACGHLIKSSALSEKLSIHSTNLLFSIYMDKMDIFCPCKAPF